VFLALVWVGDQNGRVVAPGPLEVWHSGKAETGLLRQFCPVGDQALGLLALLISFLSFLTVFFAFQVWS
ncbi:hypothetical protein ACPXA0_26585, partial [Escherichia coli]|uniref:hypothetical protein n=1 Tax=Escherichia coli TaxID=562 RepID=UPI003CE559BA